MYCVSYQYSMCGVVKQMKINLFDFLRSEGRKLCSGLILSGACNLAINDGVWRRERIKLAVIIFNLFFSFIGVREIYAFSPKNNHLWIEFQECIKEKDGALTLPLQINYGRFPDEKKEIPGFDSFRAFYSLSEKDDEGKRIFYEARIEKNKGKYAVNIKSFKADCFVVLVEAKETRGGATRWYLAKTSFVLFGHSFFGRDKIKPVSLDEINQRLDLLITPEFHYWPQTGNPVKITPIFNNDYLAQKVLYLFDENMPSLDIVTDEKGNYIYVPPEDKKLNWKGETAFKQTVIVAEETRVDMRYISSYTLLLHRSRFKNRKLLAGAGIFGGIGAGLFLFVFVKRKRFNLETL